MKTFELNGRPVVLHTWDDKEDDNIKRWFELIDPVTKEVKKTIDWSPYGNMTEEDVELYIQLGCPSRTEAKITAPICRKNLGQILEERNPQEMTIAYVEDRNEEQPSSAHIPIFKHEKILWDNVSEPTPQIGERFKLPNNQKIQALCLAHE